MRGTTSLSFKVPPLEVRVKDYLENLKKTDSTINLKVSVGGILIRKDKVFQLRLAVCSQSHVFSGLELDDDKPPVIVTSNSS